LLSEINGSPGASPISVAAADGCGVLREKNDIDVSRL
jgi:hypothetical protein